MTARRPALLILLVVWALSAATSLAAAPASFAATAIPETPWGLGTVVGVDGVMLTWFRGSTLTGGIPTEYVVHRRSPGHDADWVVATSTTADRWSYGDASAPVDVDVAYSVTARNATGDSAESVPVSARVPTWDGPYDPDRSSLTLVWDEAAGGDDTQRDSVVADLTSTPPLTQSAQGSATFSAGDWRRTLSLPSGVPDGTYELGDGAGRLPMQAMAGDFCTALAGGSVPTGSATVSRSAPSMHGGYASLTLDATLGCGNGHTVRAELRWHTPDATRVLSTAPLTRLTAAPGQAATTDVTVRNAGSKAVALEAAGLVDADMSTAAPLTVQGSSCEGITLDPGAECTVTVSYSAGDAGAREGNGVLTLSTEMGAWELGTVVGEQPAAYSGPQSLTASGSPGRVDLTWEAPTTLDSRMITGWRVEEVGSGQPAVLQKIINGYPRRTVLTSLPTGGHALRLVMLTSDGRETASSPVPVTLASRWLLVTTLTGVHSYDADGGSTNGGVFGTRTGPTDGIATSPTRTAVVVGNGPWDGAVQLRGPTGEVTRTLTVGSVYADRDPDVSPDGATVALLRLGYNGSGNSSLIIVPTAGGTPTAVPGSEGLVNPAWTPDGAALLANDGSGAGIVRINPVTGSRTTLPGTAGAIAVAVSRTGRLAYVYDWPSGPAQIRVTTLTGGSFTLVGTHAGASDLSWDPTGQWLAVTGGPYGEPQTTSLFDLRTATPTLTRQLPGGSSIAWLVPQSSVPMTSLTGPAWTNSTPTLTVGATDPDDAPGGLRRECRLDGGAWAACGPTWKLTGLAAGQHTAAARSADPSGNVSVTAERTWSVDTQVPTVTLATLPSVLTSTALRLTWTTKDTGGSGVGSVDVRYRNAPINGSFGAQSYPASWQSLKGGVLTSTLAAGKEYCFSARARDVAGNTGAWTTERCTTVTLDDRALAASGRWTRGTSSAYAFGTYSRAVASGVSLTRSSVQARRVGVVVTTCATCGAVDVYHAGVRLGRVSLYSAAPAYRQVRWLPLQSTSRTGTVVIRTTSSKPSIVDGIAAWH